MNSTVTATCPKGKRVRAGGFLAEHYDPTEGELRLTGLSRPSGRRWSVSAFKFLAEPGKLTAIAYCG